MTYTLLSGGRGYLLTRKPLICSETIVIKFKGLAADAKATVCNSASLSCIAIKDGTLILPPQLLVGKEGQLSIKVSAYDGTTMYKRWSCEHVEYVKLGEGKYLLYPAPSDRDETVVELRETVDNLFTKLKELEKKLKKTEENLNRALVGFVTE